MTTLTASEARANLYRLIDETAESHKKLCAFCVCGPTMNEVVKRDLKFR